MPQAMDKGIIPPEQIAKAGTDANVGTMLKKFHNDIHRTMHINSAVVSADLKNCYDAVHHLIASIAVQAMGVPLMAVKLVLSCLQPMFFWLRTAHGVAETPFGGTTSKPFMTLGQGGGHSPSHFTGVYTLMILSYKKLGHGCCYTSAILGVVFLFAAILYVVDTDLLLRVNNITDTDEEFIKLIQNAVMDWGLLVQATGGSLNKKKCYVSINSFKFVGGKAVLKKAFELPAKVIIISQPDGIDVPIPIIDPTMSKKTLGVLSNTAGEGAEHLTAIRTKGMAWKGALKSNKYLRPSDEWLSLNIQLKPRIECGLVGLSAKLDEVDRVTHAVYHASLGRLRVNPKMKKEFRMLPEMYQGLGMFNLNTDGLGALIFFLRQHWNMNTPISKMLRQAFEAFQMNVGLG